MSCSRNITQAARRRTWLLLGAASTAALFACSGARTPVTGSILLDEEVTLAREQFVDSATREVSAPVGSVVIAIVDELGTDVTLTLSAGEKRCEVENQRRGEGIEIAVLDVPASGTLRVALQGPANGYDAGKVHLRVEAFTPDDARKSVVANRVEGYRAYSLGTRTGVTTDDIAKETGPALERAIAAFESGAGAEPRLAAHAHIVRAAKFYKFEIDPWVARDEARAAAAAFESKEVHDALGAARARRVEAQALQEISNSKKETSESKKEADAESRRIMAELLSEKSALDPVGRGRVYNEIGVALLYAQKWDESKRNFEAAVVEYQKARYRTGEVPARGNIAALAMRRGDYATAYRMYVDLVKDMEFDPDDDSRASLLINAGTAGLNVGAIDVAIEWLLQAKQFSERSARVPSRARALQTLGIAYWARGEVEQARTFFDEAFEVQQSLDDERGMSSVLRSRGLMLRDAGDARGALAAHRASLDHSTEAFLRLRSQIEIALDYAALGERGNAVTAVRTGLRDVRSLAEAGKHPAVREAQLTLAELLILASKRPVNETAEAVTLARTALVQAEVTGDLPKEITARRVLAALALERGARDEAVRELERAIKLVITYSRGSTNPELQAATRAGQQRLFREYLDAQMAAEGNADDRRRALEMLESVRELNFRLVHSGAGSSQGAKLDGLLEQLASRNVRLAELRDSNYEESKLVSEKIQFEMATLRAEIDRVRARSSGPAVAAGTESDLQWRPLARGQVQLSYSLGTTHAYLWRRTSTGVDGWTLPVNASDIRAAVLAAARINRLQKPGAYDEALLAISSMLLPGNVVPADAVDVAIVADDELSLIPFAALRSPSDPARRFAETHAIAMVPTLLDTHAAKSAPARRWRLVAVRGAENAEGMGNGMRGSTLFPPLPGAAAEIEAVLDRFARDRKDVQVLEGTSATVEGVRDRMTDGADVMHFATHGHADLRHPIASLLSLPHGVWLTAGQIQEWQGNVGLVFLSACETAVGPTRFAEGMPGLQRAFLRAGAGNVVATLWPVEDGLAKEFAEAFYEELSNGVTPAQALARTQRRWITSASGESAQKGTRRRVAAWGYVLYAR